MTHFLFFTLWGLISQTFFQTFVFVTFFTFEVTLCFIILFLNYMSLVGDLHMHVQGTSCTQRCGKKHTRGAPAVFRSCDPCPRYKLQFSA